MVTEQARPSLASLIAKVHRLATGRAITVAEACEYFKNPKSLADAIRRSGLVDDPRRRLHLQQLLATQEKEESTHGL